MVQYIATEKEQNGKTVFGIAAIADGASVHTVEDVLPERAEVLKLTMWLQQNGVAAEHFADVLEDYIAAC